MRHARIIQGSSTLPERFAGVYGAFIGLLLLKFGNPPIMESLISPPKDLYELVLGTPWPITWAHTALAGLFLFGLVILRDPQLRPTFTRTKAVFGLACFWCVWVYVSAFTSDSPHSLGVCLHFTSALACLLMGYSVLSQARSLRLFWTGAIVCFSLMLASGWHQHFGGLEQTRRYFWAYLYPQMTTVPPDYLQKISSNRIFGTLFYPNTLAGALLLFAPPLLWFLGCLRDRFSPGARGLLLSLFTVGVAACLLWSGSKGGWLLMLLSIVILLMRSPIPRNVRYAVLALCIIGGIGAFAWRYAGFFQRGATSVGARFDYWSAASKIFFAHPITGAGPGAFGREYQKVKRPESEPTRLAHNDYLQQASDSGFPAAVAYTGFILAGLWLSRPRHALDLRSPDESAAGPTMRAVVWVGVLAFALQSGIEFVLYIPALAWPAFTLLGWLLAQHEREVCHAKAASVSATPQFAPQPTAPPARTRRSDSKHPA